MANHLPALALAALVPGLPAWAGEPEVFITYGLSRPASSDSATAGTPFGTSTLDAAARQAALRSSFQPLEVGAAYGFFSSEAWRVRVRAAYGVGLGNPGYGVYANVPDPAHPDDSSAGRNHNGDLKLQTLSGGLEVAFVSAGLGEYGFTLEARRQELTFQGSTFTFGTATTTPFSVKASRTQPFLGLHATFVQRFESVGLAYRFTYGRALGSAPPEVGALTRAEILGASVRMAEVMMPVEEIKVSLGFRF